MRDAKRATGREAALHPRKGTAMRLSRPMAAARRITLVPLIDVLFILLVYFMVTSVYRDLDMIPVVRAGDLGAADLATADTRADATGQTLLLRIDASGQVVLRGTPLTQEALAAVLADPGLADPGQRVLILPTGAAPLWALTQVMDAVARAGITDARLVRIEAQG